MLNILLLHGPLSQQPLVIRFTWLSPATICPSLSVLDPFSQILLGALSLLISLAGLSVPPLMIQPPSVPASLSLFLGVSCQFRLPTTPAAPAGSGLAVLCVL